MEFPVEDPRPIAKVEFLAVETEKQVRVKGVKVEVAVCTEVELGATLEGLPPNEARAYVVVVGLEGEGPVTLGYLNTNMERVTRMFLAAGAERVEQGAQAVLSLLAKGMISTPATEPTPAKAPEKKPRKKRGKKTPS